ncbi:hypothetical protein [Comamonas terrigena]|uniref:hypothetical protein n=1 Tax=Comamonas terrigena TaxID=32013 RepID=UPI0028969719|nr:hypothetical protein [Comamonas terrigena]
MSHALAVGRAAVAAALAQLPSNLDSRSARAILLTIGLQESLFLYRRQMVGNPPRPTGPATSFWQAEVGGGMVRGVRLHPSSAKLAAGLYALHGVQPTDSAIWTAIERNDVLAAGLARLLLYSDPQPLPALGDAEGAWQLYLRTWRPGAYTRGTPATQAELHAKFIASYRSCIAAV